MAKKRKKVKSQPVRKRDNSPQNNNVLRKKYIHVLEKVCKHTGCEDAFKLLSKEEKIKAFSCRVYVGPLKIEKKQKLGKDTIRFFTEYVKCYYTDRDGYHLIAGETRLSNFELLVGAQFISTIDMLQEKRKELLLVAFAPMHQYLGSIERLVYNIIRHYVLIANITNLFDKTIYVLKLKFEVKDYPTPGLYFDSVLESIPPRSSIYVENGNARKVHQIGHLNNGFDVDWLFVPVKELERIYKGDKKYLPVCIQTHAYHRLLERMKPISEIYILWQLSKLFQDSKQIEIYKGHILIPFFYLKHKCGYFMCVLNKNRLIIKTFLFLTHHNTPEGEKLEEILGLSKEEISYWKIGSLQNFIKSDLENNHQIMVAFEKADISHLFDMDPIYVKQEEQKTFNWDALNSYINRGKTELFDEGAEDDLEVEFLNTTMNE
ncbi:hypothetical protein [Ancylomarina longa]|uniref:Uncharacterized protein n=1 Tax=Ancylomarina longa TaxID=2487017 RepID=A0A434AW60_9BACT|nr:hypothetical protein [Ancylomarina longa]RUT78726.1 hypothetical protein DLK05_06185 [Ancylomarina longa]